MSIEQIILTKSRTWTRCRNWNSWQKILCSL